MKNNRKNRKKLQMIFRNKIRACKNQQAYQDLIIDKKFDKRLSNKVLNKKYIHAFIDCF